MAAIEAGVVVTVLVSVATAVAKYSHSTLTRRLSEKADADVEERVEDLEERAEENRRMASAAYATVHGDEDRPSDRGVVVVAREEREEMTDAIEQIRTELSRLRTEVENTRGGGRDRGG